MVFSRKPETIASPVAKLGLDNAAITERTAILVCVRNEDPARLRRNLHSMLSGLVASGAADTLHCFILSDSFKPEIDSAEEKLASDLARHFGDRLAVTYRRRDDNVGYKAGNIRDFCERWGSDFDHMVVLDADSFMTTQAILRLVRIMQADPKLGILQSLVVGMPTTQPLRAHLPVRHAARHALLHHRQRVVAGRLRTLLGPQRDHPRRALHGAVRHAAGRRQAYPQPRPGRGGADAPRRLRGARAAGEDGSWEENPPTCSNSCAAICAGAKAICSIGGCSPCRACIP